MPSGLSRALPNLTLRSIQALNPSGPSRRWKPTHYSMLLPPTNSVHEFGVPLIGQQGQRHGWLGGKQRSAEALGVVVLMGARLYQPETGRFLQPDPVNGGSATADDYCNADPVNCTDLAGLWGLTALFNPAAVSHTLGGHRSRSGKRRSKTA
jgi:RHS repeat-associated protein